jgi:hypothetical protein
MRNCKLLIISLAISAISSNPIFAQVPIAELKDEINETYLDEAPVSGRVVAGVLLTGAVAGDALLRLALPVSAAGSSICVKVMSRDGRYWAENTFALPNDFGTAPVPLEYPTVYETYLKNLHFGELAILGSPGTCGETENDELYLSAVHASGNAKQKVIVLINSGRSDTYIAVKNIPAFKRPARCKMIEEGRRTGFDTECQIDLTGVDPALQSLDVRILRRRYERLLPPTEFTLLLPKRD